MAIISKEELFSRINTIFADKQTDEDLANLEDITDTINNYESTNKDTTDWKKKYEDNDKQWRTKYRDRFFTKSEEKDEPEEVETDNTEKPLSYENLFEIK